MDKLVDENVQMIPIDRIAVLNPRERNKQKFRDIVDSISFVGLKKPIKVSRRNDKNGEDCYDLVYGQGRIEAFKMLDQTKIPAIVTDLPPEECYLMSLVENLARRHNRPMDLLGDILTLSERGYGRSEIAKKIGTSKEYVSDLLRLLRQGEERLIAAVEHNQIPISVAIEIANSDDKDIQRALTDAYERNDLKGTRLQTARRVFQRRLKYGKGFKRTVDGPRERPLTAQAMVRAYENETERLRAMVMKAGITEQRLLFFGGALRELFGDENFVTLLRAEGLETVPRQIVDLILPSVSIK